MDRNRPKFRETLTAWLGIAAMFGSLLLVLALTMGQLENETSWLKRYVGMAMMATPKLSEGSLAKESVMATKTLVGRRGLRDLYLVEIQDPTGETSRFYEGVVYMQIADTQLKELPEKPTFHENERAAADAWLLSGADPAN